MDNLLINIPVGECITLRVINNIGTNWPEYLPLWSNNQTDDNFGDTYTFSFDTAGQYTIISVVRVVLLLI